MNNLTPDEDRRRWACQLAIAYAGDDVDKLRRLADWLTQYVRDDTLASAPPRTIASRVEWTPDIRQALAELTQQGLGPTSICHRLFARFGVRPTPAAIKSKQRDLGLSEPDSPQRQARLARMTKARAALVPVAEAAD